MDTFISYEGLPINSGGAHSLGKKDFNLIYQETETFIKKFTNRDNPEEITLTFYCSQNNSYKTLPILWDLTKSLGIPSFSSWDLGTTKQRFFTWTLNVRKIQKGLDTLEKYKHLSINPYGPIVLSLKWEFSFVDKDDKRVLTGQDKIPVLDERQHNSQLYLRLSQKSTISAWFTFPFSSFEGYASSYINELTKYLPFKPSEKHWRIWHLSKKDKWTPRELTINPN